MQTDQNTPLSPAVLAQFARSLGPTASVLVIGQDARAFANAFDAERVVTADSLDHTDGLEKGVYDVVVAIEAGSKNGLKIGPAMERLRQAVAHDGALFAMWPPDAEAHRAGVIAIENAFPHSCALGVSEFAGDTLVALSEDDLDDDMPPREVVVDDRLATDRSLRGVLAVGSRRPIPMAAATIVARATSFSQERENFQRRLVELEDRVHERTGALAELDGGLERLRLEHERLSEESESRGRALRMARRELSEVRDSAGGFELEGARHEAMLKDRAAVVRSLRHEISARDVLVRDLIEELRRASASREGADPGPAPLSVPDVVSVRPEALLRSEAARQQALFEADELRGRLAALELDRDAIASELEDVRERGGTPRSEVTSTGDAALESLIEERDRARGEGLRLNAMVAMIESREEGARRGHRTRIIELEEERELERAQLQENRDAHFVAISSMRAERNGLLFRLRDREQALRNVLAEKPKVLARIVLKDEAFRQDLSGLELRSLDAETRADFERARASELLEALSEAAARTTRRVVDDLEAYENAGRGTGDDESGIARAKQAHQALVNALTGVRQELAELLSRFPARRAATRRGLFE